MYQIRLVNLNYEQQDECMSWARENCASFRGVIAYQDEFISENDEYYDHLFEDEQEAMLFGLKFGSHE